MKSRLPIASLCLVTTCSLLACSARGGRPAAAGPPPSPVQTAPIAPTAFDLEEFWKPWFASPYDYMFVAPQGPGWEFSPALAREGLVLGAGIRGFYMYGGFEDCVRAVLPDAPDYWQDDYGAISQLAGRLFRIGQEGEGYDRSFGRYDPAVLEWAFRSLVPAPTASFRGETFQQVYDRTFFRAVRVHARAYEVLHSKYDIERESQAYMKAMREQPDFYGVDWLAQRYGGDLNDAYPLSGDGTMMTGEMAMGFWLRRHVDGTESTIAGGLGAILRAYDRDFVTRRPGAMRWLGGS